VITLRCGRAALKEDGAASILTRQGLSVKLQAAVQGKSSTRGSDHV
jgi:hypothetical protein